MAHDSNKHSRGHSLRYGWHPSGFPTCACSKDFTVDHATNCPTGRLSYY